MLALKSLLEKTFLQQSSFQVKLVSQWPHLVGNLANIMTLEKIHGKTIIVGVHQQSWLQELYMLSSVILKTINEQLEEQCIEKIQFKLASSKKKIERVTTPPFDFNAIPVFLTTREELALCSIHDLELRESLKSFLIRCKKRNSL